jgi:hypothetical protein
MAFAAIITTTVSAQTAEITHEVKNTSSVDRTDIPVVIKLKKDGGKYGW